jgi:hypothetical protein
MKIERCQQFFFWIGCNNKDADLKGMIATTAKKEIAFAGVHYIVSNVVTLNGSCPSEKDKMKVEQKVKQTAGVKKYLAISILPQLFWTRIIY